jgi:hypothetical protein
VPVVLDVGAFSHDEAHVGEDGDQLVHDLHRGMDAAAPARGGRQAEVQALGGELALQRFGLQRGAALGDRGRDAVAQAVDLGAARLSLLRAHGAQGLQQGRDRAGLPERGHAHGFEAR